MPNPLEVLHIVFIAIMAIIVAANAFYAVSGVLRLTKKRSLAIEIVFFAVNAALYVGASFLHDSEVFEIVKTMPYIGDFVSFTEQYLAFKIAYIVAFAHVVFELIVQAIRWIVSWVIARKAKAQSKEEIRCRVIEVTSLSKSSESVRTIRGKTYVKSDFNAEYSKYLEQKKER